MQKKSSSLVERCKESSRKAFIKIGHSAVGDVLGDKSQRELIPIKPFSFFGWAYERPMPRRKNK